MAIKGWLFVNGRFARSNKTAPTVTWPNPTPGDVVVFECYVQESGPISCRLRTERRSTSDA